MRPRTLCTAMIDDPWVLRMLELSGWRPLRRIALTPGGLNGVWGAQRWSKPGRLASRLTGAGVVTIEDGFLRSIQPNSQGDRPLSITVDEVGLYLDASRPSRLEEMIQSGHGLSPAVRRRAEAGIARLRELGLSKYSPFPRGTGCLPEPGYALVIDQTAGDASIRGGGATAASFRAMLDAARVENTGAEIVIRTHPDVLTGRKRGHFSPDDLLPGETLAAAPANPWDLIEGASRVYAVTSQLGFEAALAGREVHLFGLPFYAGWGFTHDRLTCSRRTARRTPEEVFAASHILFPIYYDPFRDRLVEFEDALDTLARLARHRQMETRWSGEVYAGFRQWKRRNLLRYARPHALRPVFLDDLEVAARTACKENRRLWVSASRYMPGEIEKARARSCALGLVEDGFLRSVGLGAALTEAASLVFDETGMYFDPSRPSRLEELVAEAAAFAPEDPRLHRAARLREAIVDARVTKYNIGGNSLLEVPAGRPLVLVAGQVEDDASIRLGSPDVRTNLALLERARAARPDAFIVFKPHPDVEAGLRTGAIPEETVRGLADHIAGHSSPAALLDAADELWTMTSLIGFEALLRGRSVVTLGAPFYAGWGLTQDLGRIPDRRIARPGLDGLVWAALIGYPAYLDPVSKLRCEPELVVERLASRGSSERPLLSRLGSVATGVASSAGATIR